MTRPHHRIPAFRRAAAGLLAAGLTLTAALPAAAGGPSESGTLHVGDRLKITVYEIIETADRPAGEEPAQGGEAPPIQTAYPRLDLTGEYTIDPGGQLTLPLIGTLTAAEASMEAFRTALDEAFTRTFRRRSSLVIAFAGRAPVYVVGSVRNPGAFTFSPGLFVMQAVALAGGDLANAQPGPAMDLVRLREQRDTARERLAGLTLKQVTLAAESAGHPIPQADEALARIVGAEKAAALLDRERKLSVLRRQGQAGSRAIQAKAVAVAGEEVELLTQRIANYDTQVRIRSERLRTMEQLFSRQVVESERVADVRRDFADMEGRRRDLEITALQTRQRYEAAQKTLEQADLDRRLALDNDLNRVSGEVREAERAFAAASAGAALLERSTARPAEEGEVVAYTLMRRQAGGLKTLRVAEGEGLEPGDVLKVELRRAAAAVETLAAK
jgi:protein involved in polysaccharide export with SLBB domain